MPFNDYPFLLVFLPATILLYRVADPHPSLRIGVLVLLSFAFYSYWNPNFIAVLAASVLINWLAACAYAATKRSMIISAAIAANLAALAMFKYTNFLADNLGFLLGQPLRHFDIILPLGISFFTFHNIMYLVDLRRGKAPEYPLLHYALYISFFPQAVAGPLARWSEVMHQFGRRVYAPGWQRQFALGITFIVIGLVEKTMLGDPIARLIDPVYAQANVGPVSNGQAWLALGFAIQLLFDFAGYSDIAIGTGLLFGVQLPYNFDAPYRATSIQEFWRRWHMTLMMFLRDYLFHPLANARLVKGRFRVYQHFAAMFVTMALCGLWHGASWNFVLWGTLHGCALVFVSLWRRYGPRLPALLGWALTFTFVVLTDVIFRAGSVEAAWHIFRGLAILPDIVSVSRALIIVVGALCALLLPASQDIVAWLTERPKSAIAAALGVLTVVLLVELGDRDAYEFIYFQF
jgi:D-alanyl-lipoteichoic acid acyltransferase DltB (MBOAT superfamily)